jgi:hypothetical protein
VNVLENVRRAYGGRDSIGYDSLFDAAYIGTSADYSGPPSIITFTKADESQHIRALARAPLISSIRLVFPPTLVRHTDASDTLGWATVSLSDVRLEIADGPNYFSLAPNNSMYFKFRPTTPSFGSPTDTTWHIVRWSEIKF